LNVKNLVNQKQEKNSNSVNDKISITTGSSLVSKLIRPLIRYLSIVKTECKQIKTKKWHEQILINCWMLAFILAT